jgi:hypothetical protein
MPTQPGLGKVKPIYMLSDDELAKLLESLHPETFRAWEVRCEIACRAVLKDRTRDDD